MLGAVAIAAQQQRGVTVAAVHAAQIVAAAAVRGANLPAVVQEAELLLHHGAEPAAHGDQVVDQASGESSGGQGRLAVDAVEHHVAGKDAAALPHGDGGQGAAVVGQGGGHNEPIRRAVGEHRLAGGVIDPHRGLAAAFVAGNREVAVPVEGHGQYLAGGVYLAGQALGSQDIDRGAAHVIGGGAGGAAHQRGGLKLHRLLVDGLARFVQHRYLVHGYGDKAAVQRGEAAGLVAGVTVQLGAAVLVLLGLGVQQAAAQAVELPAVVQH